MTGHIRSLPLTRGETTIKNARADIYESSPQALLRPVTKHLQVTHVSLLPKVVHRALGLEQNFFHNRLIYNNKKNKKENWHMVCLMIVRHGQLIRSNDHYRQEPTSSPWEVEQPVHALCEEPSNERCN